MKYKYDASEIQESKGFDLDSYITYENQRFVKSKHKKSENFQNISKIHSIIIDRKFIEICELTDYIHENVPELSECLYDNYYSFKSYIDSRSRLTLLQNKFTERIEHLERDNQSLRDSLADLREDYRELNDLDLELRKYICEIGGDIQTRIMHTIIPGSTRIDHLGDELTDYEKLDTDPF